MFTPAPAPAPAVERIRQLVNAGDYSAAQALYGCLPVQERDALWRRLRRLTAPGLQGATYEAVGRRLRPWR